MYECTRNHWNRMKRIHSRLTLFLFALALIPALFAGCQSPHVLEPERAGAVIITNHAPEQISAATKQAFQLRQFDQTRSDGPELVFQKMGTFMDAVLTSDWASGPAWVRVRVFQQPLDAERTLLDCDVYMVQQPEDPLFQQERKLRGRKQQYQALLDEIAENLNHTPIQRP
jgi:hypothetical protein